MSTFRLVLMAIVVVGGIISYLLKRYSYDAKKRRQAKSDFDKAVDSGDRIGVIDAFNDTD